MLRVCFAFVLAAFPLCAAADLAGKVRVIDADTIDVAGTRVRLYAIDAPEMDQTCSTSAGEPFACGAWATTQVRDRFENKLATCVRRDVDRYGRVVATCEVDGADMGEVIVSEGWAFAFRRYGMDYDLTEKAAYVAGRGLHSATVEPPAAFRASQTRAQDSGDKACNIKGNISNNGRIFHVPGQEHYARTQINTGRGERWFCSPEEARAAGWRAARR